MTDFGIRCRCLNLKVIHPRCTINDYVSRDGGPLVVAQWLKYCATNLKVAGSIPDGVIGIFHRHNPSDRTVALESTQPLTETSTRSISWE
jgi:hypothetical protein